MRWGGPGVILLTAARAGIPVYGYTPIQVKQAITGTGRANKEQVTYMVQKLLHIEENPNRMMWPMPWPLALQG